MDVVIWLVGGAIVGAVGARVIGTNVRQTWLINVLVGMAGAVLTGMLIRPSLGMPSTNASHFSVGAVLVSLIGSALLVIVVNTIRKR